MSDFIGKVISCGWKCWKFEGQEDENHKKLFPLYTMYQANERGSDICLKSDKLTMQGLNFHVILNIGNKEECRVSENITPFLRKR